ncbi:Os12g0279702, partial [Oryza sativa Japonica Group]
SRDSCGLAYLPCKVTRSLIPLSCETAVSCTHRTTPHDLALLLIKKTHTDIRDLLYSSAGPKLAFRVQGMLVGLILQPTRNKDRELNP